MLEKSIFLIILIYRAILKKWWLIQGRLLLIAYGVKSQNHPIMYGMPIINRSENSTIILGSNIVLCSDSRFTDLGVSRPVILKTLRPNARIAIGSNSGLSGVVLCAAVSIEIGSECLLGADVQIFDTDFHKIEPDNRRFEKNSETINSAPVVIGDNVFIGAGSKILKGVTIGRNSVIGAGSVVTKNVPAHSIAVGNPAKVITSI